jgi:acetyltransferase-like isoleucine patch superfamily enzyme
VSGSPPRQKGSTPVIDPLEFSPWDFWTRAEPAARDHQRERLRLLGARAHHAFGDGCFVSDHASVDNDELRLGDRTYVAAGAYLTGALRAGADCSINAYAVVRGDVRLGDGVRIGAHTSILGFNHTMDDPDLPVFRQPLTAEGIRVGDDVWVGSHVVILDGVTVGDHSVLAAGAVVTKDVPAGAIVGGNPAKLLRWRIPPAGSPEAAAGEAGARRGGDLGERLTEPGERVTEPGERVTDLGERLTDLGERARTHAEAILERSWRDDLQLFVDRPGAAPTVRAQADAIELADLLLGSAPPQLPADRQAERLRGWQDAHTGRVARLLPDGALAASAAGDDPDVAYHVLSVGYALDLLGEGFDHPVGLVTQTSAEELAAFLDRLPWASDPWHAGHWVDAVGTALLWARRRGDGIPPALSETLFGWLLTHADPATGMWGRMGADGSRLLLVNGFYRAARGTFAQFGVPLAHPERVVDTVLAHVRDDRWFRPARHDACNVLDVAQPLRLTRGEGYRSEEVIATARRLLADALDRWVDGEGFGFRAPSPDGAGEASRPGLKGTEMWLATIWYLADLAGVAECLGYRPRGVHRPGPAPLA